MKVVLISVGIFLALMVGMGVMVAVSMKNAASRNLHGNARFANDRELKAYEYRGEYD
ncbi:hypothetical protein D3C76_1095690 [compost metagenome]